MASPTEQDNALLGRDLHLIFRLWEDTHTSPGFDPSPILTRLAELIEEETEIYMQKDPDPFDERHPSRTDPDCELGRMLKLLFRKDNFMTRLMNDYFRDNFFTRQNIPKSSMELNVAACRLILVIMPGLETSVVFQREHDYLIHRLYTWAENSSEPLQSYATGLLAASMEVQETATGFRDQNTHLLPIMLKRLHTLQAAKVVYQYPKVTAIENTSSTTNLQIHDDTAMDTDGLSDGHLGGGSAPTSPEAVKATSSPNIPNGSISKFRNTVNLNTLLHNELSTSNTENKFHVRNTIPIHPPTTATSQMLILRYLASMGEYQEFLGQVFENNAMQLIFKYIEKLDPKETCLAFEALKYLASLLCHKKFSIEFVANGGLQRLLQVPRPSIAATGVSIALYYLAYCEDAMERICLMSPKLISELVTYALWLLGCSHDSGRCHATMFFGLSFQFKAILDEFDSQDGLRKLYNVISVLPILSSTDEANLNDDEECAARQLVRHVCVSLKKYMESHLYFKYAQVTRQQSPSNTYGMQPQFRAPKCNPEAISDQVRLLQEMLPVRAHWAPVDKLLDYGGVTILLRIIALTYEWNYSGRAETVRSALDALSICCVMPKVHQVFCERLELPDDASTAGMNVILGAAEGEIVADAEVQKSALAVLVHCVCAPIHRPSGMVIRFGSAKKKSSVNKISEEIIQAIWECVRSTNGIIVLLSLMQIKTPITDADCIRGMACRALAGLARSDTVRQIISKLPLFANGQLQGLMRDPILQEKRTEHVQFQKYALELMERLSGKTKTNNSQFDASLANIHKANVVAQTKIQFNENQLYQLIHQHLLSRGLNDAATTLQREAGLLTVNSQQQRSMLHLSPYSFRSPSSVHLSRSRLRSNKNSDVSGNVSALQTSGSFTNIESLQGTVANQSGLNGKMDVDDSFVSSSTPIKLIKKLPTANNSTSASNNKDTPGTNQRSLQKQISSSDSFSVSTNQREISSYSPPNTITLETIITEYLTNQHALCKNPMSTCPQFDLFVPHKCPDPRPNKISGMCLNFADRFFRRHAGFNSKRLDRRLVHSNFCTTRTLRPQEPDAFFSSCDFSPCSSNIIVGCFNGEVKVYNINDNSEEFSYACHDTNVSSVKCSRDGKFLLTSSQWQSPPFNSNLWCLENRQFECKWSAMDEEYGEFSNVTQDKVLCTKAEVATIYDLHTGDNVSTFVPRVFNQYTRNRATFCPTDELILSDGVLWDVRSRVEIHKFDKLNQTLSGVFHPNGLEVVSNTEVWDLRTFHLLRTVPSLDQCHAIFSPQNVIYAISVEQDSRLDDNYGFESSFKTLDCYDYTSIATVDVKRNIHDLAVNKYGSTIAIVENNGDYDSVQESVVRLYNVGRKKNVEDEVEDEDEESEGSEEGTISDTDSVQAFLRDNGRDRGENDNGEGGNNDGDRRQRNRRRRMRQHGRRNFMRILGLSPQSTSSSDDTGSEFSVMSGSMNNDEQEDEAGQANQADELEDLFVPEQDDDSWTSVSD
ncbi:protein mahjong isoform X2 [Phlebotomus argentipes]|uniref:protein mahjong isoform X2 n=1 Tax=Phlebotomus argentipes TaxID=94469 RepID=UPI002892D71D|nr:protein mahjong isoform X2 [Phlebotomus argentipes]